MNLLTNSASELAQLSLTSLVIAVVIGFLLSLLLRFHFIKLSNASSNARDVGNILPFVVMTVVLIISIVKSSLALSLGLVGALSVIRFRTAIKEPEELAYLFMAIAIGLGLGANQIQATVVVTLAILLFTGLFISLFVQKNKITGSFLISLDLEGQEIDEVLQVFQGFFSDVELKKMNQWEEKTHVLLSAKPCKDFDLSELQKHMTTQYPSIRYSLLDNSHLYGM